MHYASPLYYVILAVMKDGSSVLFDKSTQVKMLILFVMSRLSRPLTQDILTELVMSDERITYFDVTECIADLLETEHLQLADNKYTLTAKGLRNSEILSDDLPHSVRVKVESAAARADESIKRELLVNTRQSANDKGGVNVGVSISDGMDVILSLELIAANEQQATSLEKGVRKKAQSLYAEIVKLILE